MLFDEPEGRANRASEVRGSEQDYALKTDKADARQRLHQRTVLQHGERPDATEPGTLARCRCCDSTQSPVTGVAGSHQRTRNVAASRLQRTGQVLAP